ncbi:lactonase family protein [Nocardia bhagyanarayanae]|uniref:6-phosphogluconolactonase (Cycloisomerase 2 family) n=1 Tax=Nocardia bhagyanarayanae TaxID=1215925 RepID=A0A543FFB5_9NOCA|nr:beta-propeller fold lactonase family protein [Nocardia bhagyanarayanae]TQM32547.1 6-phosphogluconolactonase (cycloisomerase 2 family) [Nocardia bhagyanarayanae]
MTTSISRRTGRRRGGIHKARVALATVLLSSASWTLSPAPPAAAAPAAQPQFMLVGGTASGTIAVLRMNADGSLTKVAGSPFDVDFGLFSVALAPESRTLYATQAGTQQVTGYHIDDQGALRPVPGGEAPIDGGLPITSTLTPDGKWLYVGVGGFPGRIDAFAVGASGALTPAGSTPVPGAGLGMLPMLTTDPDGRFLRFTSALDGNLTSFAIHADGTLSPLGDSVPIGTLPVNPGYTPDGRFVYVSQEQGGAVSGFAIGADGRLTPTPGSPYAVPAMPHNAEVSTDGRRVYIPSVAAGKVSGFAIGADGALTPLPGSPYNTPLGSGPGWVLLSDDEKHLYAADVLTTNITTRVHTYDVRADGSLAPSSLPSVDTGTILSDGPVMVKTK